MTLELVSIDIQREEMGLPDIAYSRSNTRGVPTSFTGRHRIFILPMLILSTSVAQAADLTALPGSGGAANNLDAEASNLRPGDTDSYVEIYGQINKGLLVYDDGRSTNAFLLVDNANSSTRAGIRFHHEVDPGLTIGGNVEGEWNPYSTGYVNQLNKGDVDWDTALLRKAELYFDASAYGKFWFGQGSMASDGTAEVDLSGTAVIGYASAADSASGQFYRLDDGTLSSITVGSTFSDLDGIGRRLRVRYDSPSFNGFVLGSSVGQQVVPSRKGEMGWDVALKYNSVMTDYKIAAAFSYSDPGGNKKGLVGGSASVLHTLSGWSLTVAGGYEPLDDRNRHFLYAKLGHQADYFDVGNTAYSIDTYYGDNILTQQSETVSVGGQLVQMVDAWRSEFYLGVRSYVYEDATNEYDRGFSMLTGARMKF
ncbi:MAG: porin [Anderseniella sp.]